MSLMSSPIQCDVVTQLFGPNTFGRGAAPMDSSTTVNQDKL